MEQLSLMEQSEYTFHCEVIQRGLSTFIEVGQSLLAVRDKRLYRHLYDTFEDYCHGEFHLARRTAYQLMAASDVVENVRNCAQIPANEAQARPLTALEPDEQREVWSLAVKTAPEGKVTAAHVQAVIDARQHTPTPEADDKAQEGPERLRAMAIEAEWQALQTKWELFIKFGASIQAAAQTPEELLFLIERALLAMTEFAEHRLRVEREAGSLIKAMKDSDAAACLRGIRDEGLYREHYASFEECCAVAFGFEPGTLNFLVAAGVL